MLSVEHARPSPELAPYLHGYVQRVSEPRRPDMIEPVLARSGSMLIFQFDDPYSVPLYGLDVPNWSDPITIIGPIPARQRRIIIRGRVEEFTLLFRPLGFFTIFGVPLSYFTGRGTEGGGVLGAPIRALYERLGNLRSFAERIEALELFLTERLRQRRSLHPAHRALRLLATAGRQRTVREVANEAGMSTRQLDRMSLEYCGISPVVLTRLARFQRALRLRQTTNESWMWIAHAANYYDQMHMIREFRSLAGNTPERAIRDLSPDHLISFMCK
jgi:AraC-like DNA-binding protein